MKCPVCGWESTIIKLKELEEIWPHYTEGFLRAYKKFDINEDYYDLTVGHGIKKEVFESA